MRALFIVILCLLPSIGISQGAPSLVADSISITDNNLIVAHGSVRVFSEGTRMQAERVVYDKSKDQLTIDDDILITFLDGTIITATQATLDPKLENGILQDARFVLGQHLQMAAQQIQRRNGNSSLMYQVAATSCQVCNGQTALWEIRAKSVVHDEIEHQLYFESVQFRIKGMPLAYIPRLRLPDPSLKRATGFLIPRVKTTDRLSSGLKIPYFIRIDDYRDLTLTPYLSSRTRTLEYRYRQAFVDGDVSVKGALSDDDLESAKRAYLFADGSFSIAAQTQLDFDIEMVSDPAYLLDYGYSEKDRLDSAISLVQVKDPSLFMGGITIFQTLRDDEQTSESPPLTGSFNYEKHMPIKSKGNLMVFTTGDTVFRYGTKTGPSARDLNRLSTGAKFEYTHITKLGAVVDTQLGVRGDIYQTLDDPSQTGVIRRAIPHVGLGVSFPLAGSTVAGHQFLLAPTMTLAYSSIFGRDPLNEDSTRAELDTANLFAVNRFPGEDAVETGLRGAVGLDWTWQAHKGTQTTLTFGRAIRKNADSTFSDSSGLSGQLSDWIVSGQSTLANGLYVQASSRLGDNSQLTLGSARFGWQNDDFKLAGAYIWQDADIDDGRPDSVSEWTLDSELRVSSRWKAFASTRYDLSTSRPANASLGLEYKNECATVDFSMTRRYTSSTTVEP